MKNLHLLVLPALLAVVPLTALSDPGHGKGGKYKEEYWDGNCKVKREFKHNGEYKEKRECEGAPQGYYAPAPAPAPVRVAPVMVAPVPVAPAPQPGVTIQGTIRLP